LSMHQASAPVFVRALSNLAAVLRKGEAQAAARGMNLAALLEERLAPDMFPLVRQVQIATDGPKGAVARLTGVEAPVFPDEETTFAELYGRIDRAVAFIQSVPAERFEGSEDRTVTLTLRSGELTFKGLDYLQGFVIPNL